MLKSQSKVWKSHQGKTMAQGLVPFSTQVYFDNHKLLNKVKQQLKKLLLPTIALSFFPFDTVSFFSVLTFLGIFKISAGEGI